MSPESTCLGELNLEKEEFGKRAGEGREGREKWDKRKERMEGVNDADKGRGGKTERERMNSEENISYLYPTSPLYPR